MDVIIYMATREGIAKKIVSAEYFAKQIPVNLYRIF